MITIHHKLLNIINMNNIVNNDDCNFNNKRLKRILYTTIKYNRKEIPIKIFSKNHYLLLTCTLKKMCTCADFDGCNLLYIYQCECNIDLCHDILYVNINKKLHTFDSDDIIFVNNENNNIEPPDTNKIYRLVIDCKYDKCPNDVLTDLYKPFVVGQRDKEIDKINNDYVPYNISLKNMWGFSLFITK